MEGTNHAHILMSQTQPYRNDINDDDDVDDDEEGVTTKAPRLQEPVKPAELYADKNYITPLGKNKSIKITVTNPKFSLSARWPSGEHPSGTERTPPDPRSFRWHRSLHADAAARSSHSGVDQTLVDFYRIVTLHPSSQRSATPANHPLVCK